MSGLSCSSPSAMAMNTGIETPRMDKNTAVAISHDQWICHVCGLSLSRKQRLQTHILSKHPTDKMPGDLLTKRGIYKTYDLDESVPVPKRTRIRDQAEGVAKQMDDNGRTVRKQDEIYACATLDSISDCSETQTSATNRIAGSNDEKCLAVLSYISKMRLTGTASEQLIRLLNIFGNTELSDIQTKENLTKTFDYCELCSCLFPEDSDIYKCVTPQCTGLRYSGLVENQHLKRPKTYFATSAVRFQILDILHRNEELKNRPITLTMNTDGVPLYSSSSVSLWPVFLVINQLKPSERFLMQNVIVWGIWQGRGKPIFRSFLKPLTDELNSLRRDGNDVDISLTCVTMDLQAKSQVMEMVPHNGQFACVTCETPGVVVQKGKGHTKTFPVGDPCVPRTITSMLNDADKAISSGVAQKGIRNVSILFDVDHFNPVDGVVPDYMHGVLLGTTKKLLTLWTSRKSKGQPYYIGNHLSEVDRRLGKMKPTNNISRLPRSIEKHLSHWKASELQHWLLFYSVPCLQGILPAKYLENLCFLVEGIYLLLGEDLQCEDIDKAELRLTQFQISFQSLYGLENCGLNIHNIGNHLAHYARIHGPLWGWSCFAFEDMNGTLLKLAHGTGNVSRQLLQTILMKKRLHSEADQIENKDLRDFTLDMLGTGRRIKARRECNGCSLLGKVHAVEDPVLQDEVTKQTGKENCSLQKIFRIKMNGQLISSTGYQRMQKRNCHTVLLTNGSVKSVDFFAYDEVSNRCFASTQNLKVTGFLHDNLTHLIRVEHTGQKEVVPVENLVEKVLYLDGNDMFACVARLPTFYNNCV